RLASDAKIRAGVLEPTDSSTQVICSLANLNEVAPCPSNPVLQFIEHSDATKDNGTGSFKFQFNWTPPSSAVGNIVLYAAGNAANGNVLETGDHIYTTSLTLAPASVGGGNAPQITSVTDAESCSPCGGSGAV